MNSVPHFTFTKCSTSQVYVSDHKVWIGPLKDLNIFIGHQIKMMSRSCMGTIRNIHDKDEKHCIVLMSSPKDYVFKVGTKEVNHNRLIVVSRDMFNKYKKDSVDESEVQFVDVSKNICIQGRELYSNGTCIIQTIPKSKEEQKK